MIEKLLEIEKSRVRFFPVRHYSPTSAIMLEEYAKSLDLKAVLIEGPSDFNPRIDELYLEHELPIALFTYVRWRDNTRASAFYPFCEYSPEWQALQHGHAVGADVRFIDLPWVEMAQLSQQSHRYIDRGVLEDTGDNGYIATLTERLGAENFDEVWDLLFELDPEMTPERYLERALRFVYQMRYMNTRTSREDAARETFMAQCILDAMEEHPEGDILVVTGGYHTPALFVRINDMPLDLLHRTGWHDPEQMTEPPEELDFDEDDDDVVTYDEAEAMGIPQEDPRTIDDSGLTLTPFTYPRIDKISGYQSGLHGPEFYHYVWETRKAHGMLDGNDLLYEIVKRLRDKGHVLSTSDAIAVETTAWALATMRGRKELWRYDLLDALTASVIKEDMPGEYSHPVLRVARDVFTGSRKGMIGPGADLPPLVRNTRARLHELDLTPMEQERTVELALLEPEDRQKSMVLHRCRQLGIIGVDYVEGSDLAGRTNISRPYEVWSLRWSPEHESSLIENSIYGADLGEAGTAKLMERAADIERNAEQASLIVLDAALMGLDELTDELSEQLHDIVRQDSNFFQLTKALGHLLYLFAFDDILGAKRTEAVRDILSEAYTRGLWLFEGLGHVEDRDKELMDGIAALFDVLRRCRLEAFADEDHFVSVMSRSATDTQQMPVVRGSALGALYTLGRAKLELALSTLLSFADAMDTGDCLTGFFSLAREAAQRDPRMLRTLDAVVMTLNDDQFMEVLPGYRLAFTFFTPREKHRLVQILFPGRLDDDDEAPLPMVDDEHAAAATRLEARLFATMARFGLHVPEAQPRYVGEWASMLDEDPPASTSVEAADEIEEDEDFELPERYRDYDPALFPEDQRLARWRLILGLGAEGLLGDLDETWAAREQAVGFLYDREYGQGRNIRGKDRAGGSEDSQLNVPDWINQVHELFPKRTIERLEKDALDRYQIEELVTRPELLERAEPSITMLKAVLRTKHLMNDEVLQLAKLMVRKTIQELIEKMARNIQTPFAGSVDRRRRSYLKIAKNFDAFETIRRNLKYFDGEHRKIVIQDPFFFSRIRRQVDRWQVIIVVDQSGSMLGSVIHAAVTASIFWGIRALKTNLVVFDTQVVDLTNDCVDPVELLMKVQLGGGTDIGKALRYAHGLIENPHRTIVVLVTDFYEGGPVDVLYGATKDIVESGATLLGLAALDEVANPTYDKNVAQRMVNIGAHVGAMTPGELAAWVAERVR